MNQEVFDKLMKKRPHQHRCEWRTYLELCEIYLKSRRIENPIVVELGIERNTQKKFYEELFNAYHIGVDYSSKLSRPDLWGDTHDPSTIIALKKLLGGRAVNILFIDASHSYEDAKKDYELYSPLCDGIIAFHDIELGRHKSVKSQGVHKLWDELRARVYNGDEGYRESLIVSMHHCMRSGGKAQAGIGMIIKQ